MGRLGATLSGNPVSRKKDLKAASHEETPPFPLLLLLLRGLFGSLGLFLQGLPQNVAERRARIRRAILSDRLLLLGDLHRLDREVGFLRAIEADHHGVELLADLEALRTLLVAVAAEVPPLGETDRAIVADLHVEARILDRADGDRHNFALLDAAARSRAATGPGAGSS